MKIRRLGAPLIRALPVGLREATEQLAAEVVIRKRHIGGLIKARKYQDLRGMAMQLGCADKIKKGWLNVDLDPAADLTLDLREPLPFRDSVFKLIYSEHFLEHCNYPCEITRLMSECYRVLEPGGIQSLAVPDGEFALQYYTLRHSADPALAQLHAEVAEANRRWDPSWCKTPMDHVNYFMRQNGEHRWIYDEETMRLLLETAGFVDIRRREFDPELDDEARRFGSMYMQCRKPESHTLQTALQIKREP
jgi:predicted SAM-dependent methyltransferase